MVGNRLYITHQLKQEKKTLNRHKPKAVQTMKDRDSVTGPLPATGLWMIDSGSRWWTGKKWQSALTPCPMGCILATTVFLTAAHICTAVLPGHGKPSHHCYPGLPLHPLLVFLNPIYIPGQPSFCRILHLLYVSSVPWLMGGCNTSARMKMLGTELWVTGICQ